MILTSFISVKAVKVTCSTWKPDQNDKRPCLLKRFKKRPIKKNNAFFHHETGFTAEQEAEVLALSPDASVNDRQKGRASWQGPGPWAMWKIRCW